MAKKTRFLSHVFQAEPWLIYVVMALLSLGLVMVASASSPIAKEQGLSQLYYVTRQGGFLLLSFFTAYFVIRVDLESVVKEIVENG